MSRRSRQRYKARRQRAEQFALDHGYEPFDKFDVAEWSNWVCGICYKPIDSPEELSIEHKRPLAAGGRHIPSNVVAAHRRCNTFSGGMESYRYNRGGGRWTSKGRRRSAA